MLVSLQVVTHFPYLPVHQIHANNFTRPCMYPSDQNQYSHRNPPPDEFLINFVLKEEHSFFVIRIFPPRLLEMIHYLCVRAFVYMHVLVGWEETWALAQGASCQSQSCQSLSLCRLKTDVSFYFIYTEI